MRPLKRVASGVAQVPGEAVEPGLRRAACAGAGRAAVVVALGRRRRPRPSSPPVRELAHDLARSRRGSRASTSSFSFGAALQPVVDDGARRAGSGRGPAARRGPPKREAARGGTAARPRRSAGAAIWRSGRQSSRIQNERPCVATTRSSPFTTRSVMGTTGSSPSWSRPGHVSTARAGRRLRRRCCRRRGREPSGACVAVPRANGRRAGRARPRRRRRSRERDAQRLPARRRRRSETYTPVSVPA